MATDVGPEIGRALRVLVIYQGRCGAIRALAARVGEGIGCVPGTEIDRLEIGDAPFRDLQGGATTIDEARHARWATVFKRVVRADAFVIVAPAPFDAPAAALGRFFADLAAASGEMPGRTRPRGHPLFRDKPGAALIASAAPHGGNGRAIHPLLALLTRPGMIVIAPGGRGPILEQDPAQDGATAIVAPQADRGPSAEDASEARDLGRRAAEVGTWLRAGRRAAERREAIIAPLRRCGRSAR